MSDEKRCETTIGDRQVRTLTCTCEQGLYDTLYGRFRRPHLGRSGEQWRCGVCGMPKSERRGEGDFDEQAPE